MSELIKDWDKKWKALESATGSKGNRLDAVRSIAKTYFDSLRSFDTTSALSSVYSQNWGSVSPKLDKDNTHNFLTAICIFIEQLGGREGVEISELFDSSIIEFIDYFPDDLHDQLNLAARPEQAGNSNFWKTALEYKRFDKAFGAVCFDDMDFESNISSQRIDQRMFYMHPSSADAWRNLVGPQGDYDKFDRCRGTLKKLINKAEFSHEFLRNPMINNVVILGGGGAPEKDIDLMRRTVELGNYTTDYKLTYKSLDISYWMLRETHKAYMDKGTYTRHPKNCVHPMYIIGDFMTLYKHKDIIRYLDDNEEKHKKARTLFAITGGTFGNVNEEEFFTSLNTVASKGDCLIISVSCIKEHDDDATEDHLKDEVGEDLIDTETHGEQYKYEASPHVKELVKIAMLDYLARTDAEDDINDVLNYSQLPARQREDAEDVVSGASIIQLVTNIRGRQIVVHEHTNYSLDGLILFAAERRWKHLSTEVCEESGAFAQLLFTFT